MHLDVYTEHIKVFSNRYLRYKFFPAVWNKCHNREIKEINRDKLLYITERSLNYELYILVMNLFTCCGIRRVYM